MRSWGKRFFANAYSWRRERFCPRGRLEAAAVFLYCKDFKTHSWGKRSPAKGYEKNTLRKFGRVFVIINIRR